MASKNKRDYKKETQEKHLVHHVPNEFHLRNCMNPVLKTKNKKAYSRKQKHKNQECYFD